LVVARLADEPALRAQMASNPAIGDIPFVTMTAENDDPAILIEEIRRALRG
jgi:hypothetical protein